MNKRWLALLLVVLLLCPALSAVDDLGDTLIETADTITNIGDTTGAAADDVRATAAQSFGTLGSLTAGGGAGLLPMWNFWIDFSSTMWGSMSETFAGVSGQKIQFDEYLVYQLLGVSKEKFEDYCGVLRNEPTKDNQSNMQKQGVNDFNLMLVILLILVINLALSFGYGHIDAIMSVLTIIPVVVGIILYYTFPTDPNIAMLGLDFISISIFASAMYTLVFSGSRSDSSESGAFFLILIPVAILLVSAINHLVPFSTGWINSILTSTNTSEQVEQGLFMVFIIGGLISLILGIIGFVMDLTHLGNRSVATKMVNEAKKLEGKGDWDASSIAEHLGSKYGDKFSANAENAFRAYQSRRDTLEKPSKFADLKQYENDVEGVENARQNFFSQMDEKRAIHEVQPILWPIILLIVGFVFLFVGLTEFGIVLPSLNMVAVFYLTALLTLIISLTNLPHTDPMAFFEDPDARGIIMQISHTLGYDKKMNFMTLLQNMQGKISDEKYDEEVAKMMKGMSDKAGALLSNKKIGQEMYGTLTEGYERMLRAPFYQLLQVRDAVIWSVLVLFMTIVIGFLTQQLPFGMSVVGYQVFGATALTPNELACFSMHSNILTLILWASFVVSTVIFIIRRSTFSLTMLLPQSVYTVVNTVFGKKQLFGIFARLGIGIFLAMTSLMELNVFDAQGWTFYLQPFFAISIMAAIMFISTIFYIGETFTLSTVGNISHKLFSLMGHSLREMVAAIQAGQIGGPLGGIFMVFSLLILIPHYMLPDTLHDWEFWVAIVGTISMFVIFVVGAAKKKIMTASGIFFTFVAIVCLFAIFAWDMPYVVGLTLLPIAMGFFMFGGTIGT